MTAPMRRGRPIKLRPVTQSDADHVRRVESAVGAHPGRRPTVSEIAGLCGQTPPQLRRTQCGRLGLTPRDLITVGCLNCALELIRTGVKIEAAMWHAGFRNRSNFNDRCREYLGHLASAERAFNKAGTAVARRLFR